MSHPSFDADVRRVAHLMADAARSVILPYFRGTDLDTQSKLTEGYDPDYGARPMRRAVERLLEDPLAEALLASEVKEGDVVTAAVKKKDDKISFKSKKKAGEPEKTAK